MPIASPFGVTEGTFCQGRHTRAAGGQTGAEPTGYLVGHGGGPATSRTLLPVLHPSRPGQGSPTLTGCGPAACWNSVRRPPSLTSSSLMALGHRELQTGLCAHSGPEVGSLLPVSPEAGLLAPTCLRRALAAQVSPSCHPSSGRSIQGGSSYPSNDAGPGKTMRVCVYVCVCLCV